MKSPMLLWRKLAEDLGERCCVSTTLDVRTAERRVEHEGDSFLTITLPKYARDFERSLADGQILRDGFQGFKLGPAGLPRFLGGFLAEVFDTTSGVLMDNASADAVFAIRQLCRFAGKILLPCTSERRDRAFSDYVAIEEELVRGDNRMDASDHTSFLRVSRLLFGSLFSHCSNLVANGELIPKHGPGSTADRLLGNQKYDFRTWTDRLECGGFPSSDYIIPNHRHWKRLDSVQFLPPEQETPVRVIAVPKTLEKPRIIAIEPVCMQYAQQAVARALISGVKEDKILRRMVGFSDQEVNQAYARLGSRDGSLATLDLSEASDRLSNSLVKTLFQGYTDLSEAVQACRSLTAEVPTQGKITLVKYASMGSALTFPLEAIVFTTLVFMGIEEAEGHPMSRKRIERLSDRVRIFGDDIIVPVEYAESVMRSLEKFNFKVNANKSFWTGRFRESCGKDYWNGYDVSVVKIRTMLPSSRRDVREIISTTSLRNQLFKLGLSRSVELLDQLLGKLLKHYPEVGENSSLLGRLSYSPPSGEKLSKATHTPVSRGWVVKSKLPVNEADDLAALLKFFLKESRLPSADEEHLTRSGRPVAVNIKLRWATPV